MHKNEENIGCKIEKVRAINLYLIQFLKLFSIGEEFTIFSGGIPEDLADRDTLTLFCADKSLILDFDSPLLDFIIFQKDGQFLCNIFKKKFYF